MKTWNILEGGHNVPYGLPHFLCLLSLLGPIMFCRTFLGASGVCSEEWTVQIGYDRFLAPEAPGDVSLRLEWLGTKRGGKSCETLMSDGQIAAHCLAIDSEILRVVMNIEFYSG